jgi:hypothetical protein
MGEKEAKSDKGVACTDTDIEQSPESIINADLMI